MIETTPPLAGSPNPAQNPDTVAGESEIQGLIEQAQETAGENRSFMEPKTTKKNKGGRPRKDPADTKWQKPEEPPKPGDQAQTPPPPPFESATACKMVFGVLSGIIVKATHIQDTALKTEEIENLGLAWGKVLDNYLPTFLQEHGDLLTALTVTGAVGFRINQAIEQEIFRRRADAAKNVQSETVQ